MIYKWQAIEIKFNKSSVPTLPTVFLFSTIIAFDLLCRLKQKAPFYHLGTFFLWCNVMFFDDPRWTQQFFWNQDLDKNTSKYTTYIYMKFP